MGACDEPGTPQLFRPSASEALGLFEPGLERAKTVGDRLGGLESSMTQRKLSKGSVKACRCSGGGKI